MARIKNKIPDTCADCHHHRCNSGCTTHPRNHCMGSFCLKCKKAKACFDLVCESFKRIID